MEIDILTRLRWGRWVRWGSGGREVSGEEGMTFKSPTVPHKITSLGYTGQYCSYIAGDYGHDGYMNISHLHFNVWLSITGGVARSGVAVSVREVWLQAALTRAPQSRQCSSASSRPSITLLADAGQCGTQAVCGAQLLQSSTKKNN